MLYVLKTADNHDFGTPNKLQLIGPFSQWNHAHVWAFSQDRLPVYQIVDLDSPTVEVIQPDCAKYPLLQAVIGEHP